MLGVCFPLFVLYVNAMRNEEFPFTTPEGSDAHMFIQWKGTDVCLDFHCPCGAHCHLHGDFAYFVECGRCHTVYEMGTQVIAKVTTDPGGEPKVMEDSTFN